MFKPIKIRHYIRAMRAHGFSAEDVLVGSGIRAEELDDPARLVGLAEARTVISNMIRLSDAQGIGLDIGYRTELVDLGLVGHALMTSRTVREAVECWANYSNTLVGMLVRVELDPPSVDGRWSLRIVELYPLGFIYNFCAEECLTMIRRLGDQITGGMMKQSLERVECTWPAPAHHAQYSKYFDAAVVFNSHATRICFNSPSLEEPLVGHDSDARNLFFRQCVLSMHQINRAPDLKSLVLGIFARNPSQIPTAGEVAAKLNMSERTLRRRLDESGQNWQAMIKEFRIGLATDYLKSTNIPAKEIAWTLGFKDSNSFYRAFKDWTGYTVQAYREQAR